MSKLEGVTLHESRQIDLIIEYHSIMFSAVVVVVVFSIDLGLRGYCTPNQK